MQLQDLEVLKEIPGYPAILKAVLKTQIQMLVEQLSDQTGEESIILTASISDGTLCHLGSNRGKDFLDGRDDLKSQFLKHCLNKDNKRPYPEETDVNPRQAKGARYIAPHTSTLSEASQKKAAPSTSKKRKPATVTSETPNVRVTPSPRDHSTPVSKETRSEVKNNSASVKLELPGDDLGGVRVTLNQNTDDETIDQTEQIEESGRVKERPGHRLEVESTGESGNNVTETFDSSEIKMEPMNQDELELEITGVEMGGDSTWSGGGLDYSSQQSEMPTEAGDASNQSGAYNSATNVDVADQMAQDSIPEVYSSIDVNLLGVRRRITTAGADLGQPAAHACDYCGKSYDRRSNLEEHVNLVHLGISRFTCEFCGKQCARAGQLRDHMHTHNKLTPYKCETCNRSYASKPSYNRHIRNRECTGATPEIVKLVPECDVCGKMCKHMRSLKEHKRTAHGGHVYTCPRCMRIFRYRSSLNHHKKKCIDSEMGDDKIPSFTT